MEENFQQPIDAGLQGESTASDANDLRFTPQVYRHWKEISIWGIAFSVLSFLLCAFLLLVSISALWLEGDSKIFLLVLVAGLVILFTLSWLLFNFSRHLRKAVLYQDVTAAHVGFVNLRRLFQFSGILQIAAIVIYGIVLLDLVILLDK